MKTNQLTLIEGERYDWKLDPNVRQRGFRGVAAARAALAASRPRHDDVSNIEAA